MLGIYRCLVGRELPVPIAEEKSCRLDHGAP